MGFAAARRRLKNSGKTLLHLQGFARSFRHFDKAFSDARGDAHRAQRRKEQYTFEDVSELTLRAAGFFATNGIKPNDRVILFSNNMPEWGMTYFGILKTGATAIPIDPASSVDEIVNFAKAGEASAIVVSPETC